MKTPQIRAMTITIAMIALAVPAFAQISTTTEKISWDIIGLDSNDPANGPTTFMIGGRLCNTGMVSIENVEGVFSWGDGATDQPDPDGYIDLADSDLDTITLTDPIHPGECRDFYYNGEITNTDGTIFNSVANRTREYSIDWTFNELGNTSNTGSNSVSGWLYAEALVSQNRNSVEAITGPTNLQVGGIYTFKVDWSTATNGYEQLQHFVNLSNTSFLLLESHSTYTAPAGDTNDSIYFDACGWIYDSDTPPDSPGMCTNKNKAGGTVDTWFTVQILSPAANAVLNTLIYDFSGSSFHYNSDFGDAGTSLTVTAEAAADLSVTVAADNPLPEPGDLVTFSGTVCNNGPSEIESPGPTEFDILVPSDTLFQSFTAPSGFSCTTPAFDAAGPTTITCTNSGTFSVSASCPTYSLVVRVDPNTTPGISIQTTASVTSPVIDSDSSNNSASTTVSVSRSDWADLAVQYSAPAAVVQGTSFDLTATVTNNGPATSEDVTFETTVPSGFTVGTITPPLGWTCSTTTTMAGETIISCETSSLAASTNASFTFPLTPSSSLSGTIQNIDGFVQSDTTGEATYANNEDDVDVSILNTGNEADLAVTVSDSPDPVGAGETINYTQTITNNGLLDAVNPTLTASIPTGTTFTYIDPPAGWSCFLENSSSPGTYDQPLVSGSTGSYRCTFNGTLAPGESASLPLWVQTSASATSGSTISYSATVASDTTDSVTSNNTSGATTVVGAQTSADVAITKTASAGFGYTGENLTYTLRVVNRGPAKATNVTVTDNVPSDFTLVSASSTLGTCTTSGNQVTCNIVTGGTEMNIGQTAVVTIVATPNTEDFSGYTNTGTVSATQSDPNSSNNSSSVTTPVAAFGPTAVESVEAEAIRDGSTVHLAWSTGFEVANLGFNLYRESGSIRTPLNATPVIGSALIAGEMTRLTSGYGYTWTDESPVPGSVYWIESIGLDGTTEMHGPFVPKGTASARLSLSAASTLGTSSPGNSPTLGELSQRAATVAATPAVVVGQADIASASIPDDVLLDRQLELAAGDAAKILVSDDGLYRVSKASLVAAGFDPGTNPDALRLFVNAEEVPIGVNDGGDRRFDSEDSFEFYALGLDSMYSGTRTYWLVTSSGSGGKRFHPKSKTKGPVSNAQSFMHTLERKDRILHFAALTSAEREDGFYGPVVFSVPVDQTFEVSNLANDGPNGRLELSVQGALAGVEHRVDVTLNGHPAGVLSYSGTELRAGSFEIPNSWLHEGTNTVALRAVGGPRDVSFLDWVRLTYPHTFDADDDRLTFPVTGRTATTVSGFSSPEVRVLDITDPFWPLEVDANVTGGPGNYSVTVSTHEKGSRIVTASTADKLIAPSSITSNSPSQLSSHRNAADLVVITHPDFEDEIAPLVARRQSEGFATIVASVDDVYDEFGFGTKSPQAIRDFLEYTTQRWKQSPRYVLLVGDASFDPRNYVGHGAKDLVPTKTVPTRFLMSVSDDWLVDFDDDSLPNMHVGRLSVATSDEARAVVSKLLAYSGASSDSILVVSDRDDAFSYEQAGRAVATVMSGKADVTHVRLAEIPSRTDQRSRFVSEVNGSPAIVDYIGHASVNVIGRNSFFGTGDVGLLHNEPSMFVMMNCFNTLFQGSLVSLGEGLLRAPDTGAVAVWGSSAMTLPWSQNALHLRFYRALASDPTLTLGELSTIAKSGTTDPDVRRTWILLGDPTMRLQQ